MFSPRRILALLLSGIVVGLAAPAAAQTVTAITGAADFDSGVAAGPDGRIYVISEYRGIRSFAPGGGVLYTGPANTIDGRQMSFFGASIATAELYVAGINRNLGGIQRGGIYLYPAGCAATPDAGGCAAQRITLPAPSNGQQYSHYGVVADATNVYATSEAGEILRFPRGTCTPATPCDPTAYVISSPGATIGALQLIGGVLYVASGNGVLRLPANCAAPCAPTVHAAIPGAGLRGIVDDGAGGLFVVGPGSDTVRRVAPDGTVSSYVTDVRFDTPSNITRLVGDLYLTDFAAGGTFWRVAAPIPPVPTLGEWAMIGLGGLIALMGATLIGRRRLSA